VRRAAREVFESANPIDLSGWVRRDWMSYCEKHMDVPEFITADVFDNWFTMWLECRLERELRWRAAGVSEDKPVLCLDFL